MTNSGALPSAETGANPSCGRIQSLLAVKRRIDGEHRAIGDQQRVAVAACGLDRLCRDGAVAARPVVDDDLLVPLLGQRLRQHAGDGVGEAAGRVRHHQFHRFWMEMPERRRNRNSQCHRGKTGATGAAPE